MAVDSETHLIRDFEMTNQVTDHGMLSSTMEGIRSDTPGEILEVVADKGYEDEKGIIKCLENGIIPHVIEADGKDGYELEIPYGEAEADTSSTDSEELKKSLHARKIPKAYKEVITDDKSRRTTSESKGRPSSGNRRKAGTNPRYPGGDAGTGISPTFFHVCVLFSFQWYLESEEPFYAQNKVFGQDGGDI